MVHARADYDRFQDPALEDPNLLSVGSTPIGVDEPVCLFRAQDKHFVGVLEDYKKRLEGELPDVALESLIGLLDAHIQRARDWQATHKTKSPDV